MITTINTGTGHVNWEYRSPVGDNFSHTEPKLGWNVSEKYIPQQGSPAPEDCRLFSWSSRSDVVHDETGPATDAQQYSFFARDLPIVLVTLIAPGILLVRALRSIHRRRRFARGQCVNCGYDLRASLDRCPECGLAVGSPRGPIARSRVGLLRSWLMKAVPRKQAWTGVLLIVCTVACVAMATLWYRSREIGDVFDFLTPKWQVFLLSRSGEIQFEHHTLPPPPVRHVYESRTVWELEYRHFPSSVLRYVDGGHVLKTINDVDVIDDGQGPATRIYVHGVTIRDWALISLTAAFPAAFLTRHAIRRARLARSR